MGHLGENLSFSVSLGTDEIPEDSLAIEIDQISEILKLKLIFKLSFSKPFGTIKIMLLLQVFEKLWSFIIWVAKGLKHTSNITCYLQNTMSYSKKKIKIPGREGRKVFIVLCTLRKLANSPNPPWEKLLPQKISLFPGVICFF